MTLTHFSYTTPMHNFMMRSCKQIEFQCAFSQTRIELVMTDNQIAAGCPAVKEFCPLRANRYVPITTMIFSLFFNTLDPNWKSKLKNTRTHTHTHRPTYTHTHTHIYIYIFVCVCVCMCVCVCVYCVTTLPLSVSYGGAKPLGPWVRTSNFVPCG